MPKPKYGGIGGAMNVNGYTILDDKNANILGLQDGQAANLASRIAPGKMLKSNAPKPKATAKECPFKDQEICMVARRRILRVLEEVLSYNLFTEEKERTARRLEMYDACFELGRACNQAQNHEEAAKYLKKARNGYEEELGRDSEKALEVTLGYILCTTWNIDKDRVEKLMDLVKRAETSLGPEKVVTLDSLSQLGTCLQGNGNFKEAGKVWERCLAGQDAVLGKHHKDTLKTLNDLGNVNLGMKKHDEALDYFKRAKKGWESVLGKLSQKALGLFMDIAIVYHTGTKEWEKAEVAYLECLDGYEETLGKDHQDTKNCAKNFANLVAYAAKKKPLQAIVERYPWLIHDQPLFQNVMDGKYTYP